MKIGIGLGAAFTAGISLLQRVRAIFSTGTNGAIYDYYPASNLNQLSTGTTPVTAVTDPVGLSLDSRLGLAASTKGTHLSGAAGTYLSSPDSVAASITGDIDISAEVAMTTWTPTTVQDFVAKYSTAPNLSFVFGVRNEGTLRFLVSTTGSNNLDNLSTAGTGFAAGTKHFVRATRQASSGDINFYTSSDGISWTQLGTTVAGTAGNIFDGTAPVTLSGYNNAAGEAISGKLYSAKIRNGIAGTLAVNYNGIDYVTGPTLTSSTTGEVWTLNGAAYIAPDGNHALQATAAARPTWTNRVNLLTYSEQFDNADWVKDAVTVSVNATTAPNGTLTADKLINNATTDMHGVRTIPGLTAPYTQSVYAKAGELSWCFVGVPSTAYYIHVNLATGAYTVDAGVTGSVQVVGNGWYRISVTATSVGAYPVFIGASDTTNVISTGDGTSGIYIWGAQLELGSTATTYQRVITDTDFDTVGFPYYLSFLGTDDCLTSATGGGGSAGFFWCGAVQPTGGAGALQTLFADNGTNTGYKVQKDVNNKLSLSAGDNTTFTTKVSTAALSTGTKYMLTVWDDGTNLNVQIDGAAAETVARPVVVAGTAGYTIAKDNGAASSFYIGNKYPGVYARNTGLTAAQRDTIQAWVKQKAGIV